MDPFDLQLESQVVSLNLDGIVRPEPAPGPLPIPPVDDAVPAVTPHDLSAAEVVDSLRGQPLISETEIDGVRILLETCTPATIDEFFRFKREDLDRLTATEMTLYEHPLNEYKAQMTYGEIVALSGLYPLEIQAERAFSHYNDSYAEVYGTLERKVRDWIRYDLPRLKTKTKRMNIDALSQILFVINCAFKVIRKHYLRPVQLAAVALMILKPKQRGRLLEIKTGEGKSNIVVALAIIRALFSKSPYVDIVTSHEELAERDADGAADIYAVFNLTCGTNITPMGEPQATSYRECYDLHILYGTASSFIFDLLGTEYYLQGQRDTQKRPFATVIADEVDSMFMDRAMDVCRLAGYAVGYADILLAIIKIWIFVGRVTISPIALLDRENGERFTYCGDANLTREELLQRLTNDLEAYLDSWDTPVPMANDQERQVYEKLTERGRAAMNVNNLLCPTRFSSAYLQKHLSKYLESALSAKFLLHPRIDYRVANQQIIIVDKYTGEDKIGMSWRDGLHQFLQLKHGLELNKETLETNLMTTKAFFLRYSAEEEKKQRELRRAEGQVQAAANDNSNTAAAAEEEDLEDADADEANILESGIYGLSGTLGKEPHREFLSDLYAVDSIDIATNKPILRRTLDSIITGDPERHCQRVYETCAIHLDRGKPVLIICDTIKLAEEIFAHCQLQQQERRVPGQPPLDIRMKVFSMEEADFAEELRRRMEREGAEGAAADNAMIIAAATEEKREEEEESDVYRLDSRQVLVATNLLGRGADIELTEAAALCGGLHVCVAFNPPNRRVLYQAYGRAGRKGLPGSCQIVSYLQGAEPLMLTPSQYEDSVMRGETRELDRMRTMVAVYDAQEAAFRKYCALLREMPDIRNPKDGKIDMSDPVFRTVEEHWAKFFRLYSEQPEELEARFDAEVRDPLLSQGAEGRRRLVQSPGFLVRMGNKATGGRNNACQESIAACDEALNRDPRHVPAAVQRMVHMLNANSWDAEPVYPRERILEAIRVGREVAEAAIDRITAVQVTQRAVATDAQVTQYVTSDNERQRRAQQEQLPRSFDPNFNISDLGLAPGANARVGFTETPDAYASQMGNTRIINRHLEHFQNDNEATEEHQARNGPQKSSLPPAAKPYVQCLERLQKLEGAVNSVEDIRELMATYDTMGNAQAETEAREEGLPGYPKPASRPNPKKRGSWWPILVGALCCCVGGFLVAGAAMGTGAFMGGVSLLASGVQDIFLGIHSLTTGVPVKFGDWFTGKAGFVANSISQYLKAMTPLTQSKWTVGLAQGLGEVNLGGILGGQQQTQAQSIAGPQAELVHDATDVAGEVAAAQAVALANGQQAQAQPVRVTDNDAQARQQEEEAQENILRQNIMELRQRPKEEIFPGSFEAQERIENFLDHEQQRLVRNEHLRAQLDERLGDLRRQLKMALLQPDSRIFVRLTMMIGGYIKTSDQGYWNVVKRRLSYHLRGREATSRLPRVQWIGPVPSVGIFAPVKVHLSDVTNVIEVLRNPNCLADIFEIVGTGNPDLSANAYVTAFYNILGINAPAMRLERLSSQIFDREIIALYAAFGYVHRPSPPAAAAANAMDSDDEEEAEEGRTSGPSLQTLTSILNFRDPRLPPQNPMTRLFKGLIEVEKLANNNPAPVPPYWEAFKECVTHIADVAFDAVLEALQEELDRRESRRFNL